MPRQAALALEAFEHRRFLAADIGAGAAAQLDRTRRRQPRPLERRDLGQEDLAAGRILIAQIDVARFGLDGPLTDQQAFEEPMRIGLQEMAVLESAGLALIGVDREIPGTRFGADEAPFAPGRKPGAAETTQPGGLQRLDHGVDRKSTAAARFEPLVSPFSDIGLEPDIARDFGAERAAVDRGSHPARIGRGDRVVPDRDCGRTVAGAHAGCAQDAHIGAGPRLQGFDQRLRAHHFAGDRIAYPDRGRRRARLIVLQHVEMVIEGRDLVDFGQRHPHLVGKCHQMGWGQAAFGVLDQM